MTEAPLTELHDPALHNMQVEDAVAPTTVDQVPWEHAVHVAAANVDHDPALQEVHCASDVAPVTDDHEPALHAMHCDESVAPIADDQNPGKQRLHCAVPAVLDHEPALQREHPTEEALEYCPKSQEMQAVIESAPAMLESVPALHATHCETLLAPRILDQNPALQLAH